MTKLAHIPGYCMCGTCVVSCKHEQIRAQEQLLKYNTLAFFQNTKERFTYNWKNTKI